MAKRKSPSIGELASAIYDNGRRGMPKLGCDCEQCFGYCLVDHDEAVRRGSALGERGGAGRHNGAALDFDE